MKIRTLLLILTSSIIFTGCGAFKLNMAAVNSATQSQYPILYEVTYGLDCQVKTGGLLTFQFRKGQRFAPKDFSGVNMQIHRARIQGNAFPIKLPKNTIGLEVYGAITGESSDSKVYMLIYPNGQFISDSQVALWSEVLDASVLSNGYGIKQPFWSKGLCTLKDGKPLFKKVTNK